MISQEVLAMDLAGHSLFSCWKSNCPFPVSSLRKVSKKNTTNCDFCGVWLSSHPVCVADFGLEDLQRSHPASAVL